MATRLYSINPDDAENKVTEAVGSAVATKCIELTVDIATTVVNANGSTRALTKSEVLQSIDKIKNYIIKSNWPPA